MATNFALAEFKPQIASDKVSLDGYDVTNLVSSNPSQQRNGFMCERFVRTPVNVTFHFPFNIDISTINLNTAVGSQRSTGLEIHTHSVKERRHTWLFDKVWETHTKAVNNLIFSSVGRKYHPKLNSFHFVNNEYRPRPFGKHGTLPTFPEQENTQTLSARRPFSLSNVTYLTVRILQTANGSIPCLRTVEIWGQPAMRTSMGIVNEIFTILDKKKIDENVTSPKTKLDKPKDGQAEKSEFVIDSVEIPSDFIDPITCDLMSLPVILPSGYTVDQSTMEKHNEEEAKWGHASSDPFTGIRFSADKKPVVNVSLKARIDKFLLTHSDRLKTVPRTVGSCKDLRNKQSTCTSTRSSSIGIAQKRKYDSHNNSPSTYSEWKKAKHEININMVKLISTDSHELPKDSNKDGTFGKKIRDDIDLTENFDEEIDLTIEEDGNHQTEELIDLTFGDEPIDLTDTVVDYTSYKISHENKLQRSLDSALDGALSSLPSFTKKKTVNKILASVKCLLCETSDSNNMYSMPCGQLICRNCLTSNVSKSGIYCASCLKEHPSNAIQKKFI